MAFATNRLNAPDPDDVISNDIASSLIFGVLKLQSMIVLMLHTNNCHLPTTCSVTSTLPLTLCIITGREK